MEATKYRLKRGSKTKPYAVPLPSAVEQELREYPTKYDFNVRACLRDLILENLPKIRKMASGK